MSKKTSQTHVNYKAYLEDYLVKNPSSGVSKVFDIMREELFFLAEKRSRLTPDVFFKTFLLLMSPRWNKRNTMMSMDIFSHLDKGMSGKQKLKNRRRRNAQISSIFTIRGLLYDAATYKAEFGESPTDFRASQRVVDQEAFLDVLNGAKSNWEQNSEEMLQKYTEAQRARARLSLLVKPKKRKPENPSSPVGLSGS